MVYNRCPYEASILITPCTKRMLLKEHKPCFTPPVIIPTLISARTVVPVKCFMLFAVIPAVWYELVAPRVLTWYVRSAWHLCSLLSASPAGVQAGLLFIFTMVAYHNVFTALKMSWGGIAWHVITRLQVLLLPSSET